MTFVGVSMKTSWAFFLGASHLRPADSCFGEALRRGWMLVVTAIISFLCLLTNRIRQLALCFSKVILLYRSQKDWFTAKKMVFRGHLGTTAPSQLSQLQEIVGYFFREYIPLPDRCKNNPLKHFCLEACNFCLRR